MVLQPEVAGRLARFFPGRRFDVVVDVHAQSLTSFRPPRYSSLAEFGSSAHWIRSMPLLDLSQRPAVAHPKVPLHAELLARHRHHAHLVQQELRQLLGLLVVGAEIREAVEGAARLGHLDAGDGLEPRDHHVAVVLQRHPQALDRRLDAVERAHRGPLRRRGRPGGLLRLDVGHGAHQFLVGDRPADAETRSWRTSSRRS